MQENIYYLPIISPVEPDLTIRERIITEWKSFDQRGIIKYEGDQVINSWLNTFDLAVAYSEAFYTPPGMTLGIHTDGRDKSGPYSNRCKINWIYGAPTSVMKWFAPISDEYTGIDHVTKAGTVSRVFEKHMIKEVFSSKLKSPSLLNVGRPHTVVNDTPEQRWCFSYTIRNLRNGGILQWSDAIKILDSVIDK
jgi:hypothetical protein